MTFGRRSCRDGCRIGGQRGFVGGVRETDVHDPHSLLTTATRKSFDEDLRIRDFFENRSPNAQSSTAPQSITRSVLAKHDRDAAIDPRRWFRRQFSNDDWAADSNFSVWVNSPSQPDLPKTKPFCPGKTVSFGIGPGDRVGDSLAAIEVPSMTCDECFVRKRGGGTLSLGAFCDSGGGSLILVKHFTTSADCIRL